MEYEEISIKEKEHKEEVYIERRRKHKRRIKGEGPKSNMIREVIYNDEDHTEDPSKMELHMDILHKGKLIK